MTVSVVCPACDMEQTADTPGGTIQCRTCWAKVPVPSVSTTTPPPGDISLARKAAPPADPPRATRVDESKQERKMQSRHEAKSGNWVGAAVLLGVVTICGGAVVAFMWPTAEVTQVTMAATTLKERPTGPESEWQQRDTGRGAKLFAPGRFGVEEIAVKDSNGTRPGQRFTVTSADGDTAEVFTFTRTDTADRDDLVASFLEVPAGSVTRVGRRTITGGEASEFSATESGFEHTALVAGRGKEWCLFHLKLKAGGEANARRKEMFVANAAVTWTRSAEPLQPKPTSKVQPSDRRRTR